MPARPDAATSPTVPTHRSVTAFCSRGWRAAALPGCLGGDDWSCMRPRSHLWMVDLPWA